MTFSELAASRYSVRAFRPDPIEEEKLQAILQAGRVAPTACNYQPQRVYVARSEASRKKLAELSPCTFDAPVILVICYDKARQASIPLRPGYTFGEVDAAIVTTHMMLQAWELGIGSCWVGMFRDDIGAALGLPENEQVSALLPLGYPAEGCRPARLHSAIRDAADTISYL